MMIRTYDDKDKATYDLEGLEEYFRSCIEHQDNVKREAILKAEAYYSGFKDAMYSIAGILGASNYRVKEDTDETT